jgi:hypothetical protein
LGTFGTSELESTSLEMTPGALEVISAMEQRVAAVAAEYGFNSPEHVEMLHSLVRALGHMLRLGGRLSPRVEHKDRRPS